MDMDNKLVKEMLQRVDLRLSELDISKEKFYKESGVSSASFSQWNTGVHQPTTKKLQKMADYLGVTVDYLITGKGEKQKKPTQEGELTEKQIEAIEFVKTLDEQGLKRFMRLAKAWEMNENPQKD